MPITQDEVVQATKERIEATKIAKSERWIAERAANEKYHWYEFIKAHLDKRNGQGAVESPYYHCEANTRFMEAWCKEQIPPQVNRANLENAFEALTQSGQLAKAPAAEYKQQTESRMPLAQRRTEMPPPPVTVNMTAAEIRSLSALQLRRLMARPGMEAALDKVLKEDRS